MRSTRSRRPAHLVTLLLIGSLVACAPGESPRNSPTASGSGTAATGEPAITIASPIADARVTVPVTADGAATTAEGALTLDLLTEGGETLCTRHVVATMGTGTAGTAGSWQADLAFVPPDDDQAATLRAYELNPGDGTVTNVVETPVVITSERPPIIITAPVCGATVAPGGVIAVTGQAQVLEAQMFLELRDAAGAVLVTQEITAEGGTEESNFNAMVTVPADVPGGFYDLVGYETGAEGGSVKYEFPVQIQVP